MRETAQLQRENTQLLRDLVQKQTGPSMVKVQEAARILSISAARIREMCDSGIIKATLISKATKNKHWVINIQQAREDLTKGGYLALAAASHKRASKRGKVSTLNLNHPS
jgi:hypothetical protein